MKNVFYTLSIMMLSAVAAIAQTPVDFNKALYLTNTEQTNKAIELLQAGTQANPTDATAWYYLGYVQIKRGELDKASASFDKGISINDKEPLNYVGKGYVKVLQNNPVESKQLFDKALLLTKSKNPVVLNAVAEAYLASKQYTNDALALLQKSKSINDKDAKTYILLGDAYLQQNNGGQAVSSYEKAASIDTKDARPYFKMGQVYLRSKNYPVGIESFEKAISIDPNYTLAYRELGEIYYGMKEGAKAVTAQEKYLSLTENPGPGRYQLAYYYFMAKNYAKTNELFRELIKRPDVTPTTLKFYAKSLTESDSIEQSLPVWSQYFTTAKPEEVQASDYKFYAEALTKIKQDSLALIAITNSLALDSTQIDLLQLQGETLIKKKKFPEAITVYKKLMAKRPKPASADLYAIGRAYYYNQQLVEADTAFSQLIRLQPTMTVGYLWESRIKANADPESTQGLAKPYFEKLIEIASANPAKNKNDLIEAYSYLGYYYYLKKDNATSKSYWEKVLAINPSDARATEAIGILKKLMAGGGAKPANK